MLVFCTFSSIDLLDTSVDKTAGKNGTLQCKSLINCCDHSEAIEQPTHFFRTNVGVRRYSPEVVV